MTQMRLRNGIQLPAIGLGTYKARGDPLVQAVQWALDAGLTHIDTALSYKNAEFICKGLTQSERNLDGVFVTHKIGPRHQGTEAAHLACEQALNEMKTDALDLMLVHWPGVARLFQDDTKLRQIRRETWQVLEEFYKAGRFRAIGVSNYEIRHLNETMTYATVQPMVNQIEVHPRFPNMEVRQFCKEHDIQVVAYSSFGTGDLIGDVSVGQVAQRQVKSPAQILLKWGLQQDMAVIPKSVRKERIEEWSPAKMDGWELSSEDMAVLDRMNDGRKYCWDPVRVA